jgi:hypothetical protein
VTYPNQYGDHEAWRDPQGWYQRGEYQQDPYQQDQYRRGPQRGMYRPVQDARPSGEPERLGGAEGNERLTVMTGAVLLLLLAAEGFTILRIGRLLTLHFFLGMLLLGPVALKAGSVTYRFFRYYTGSVPYRRKGPPAPLLRVLGPLVMVLTACVFGSGVILAIVGPSGRQPWLLYHKASFILWLAAMAIHVLAYVPRLPRLLYAEARGVALPAGGGRGYDANGRPIARAAQILGGRGVRLSLLIASLAAGLVIALLTIHLAGVWESPGQFFHHH